MREVDTVVAYNGIVIDYTRDNIIPEKGLVLLTKKGFYKKEHEDSPQQGFARAATCFSFGDYDFAQRIYDYASKQWFTNASPVLSNAMDIEWPTFSSEQFEEAAEWLEENVVPDGMPISCFLSFVADNKKALVDSASETRWLSMSGGGIGIYMSNRAPDEKSTGVMAHLRGYDADALSYKQTECYSPETQLLTGRGWIRFDETLETDLVATVDDYGDISFEKPSEWLSYDYTGEMINFKMGRKNLDLKVTPNHNMVVQRKRRDGWSNLEKVEAKKLKHHNQIKILTSSLFDNRCTEELSPIERLMIAHQADGHNYKATDSIGFHISKPRKIERLKNILDDCGIDYTITEGDGAFRFYIKHPHLPKDLNWIDLENTSQAKAVSFINEISQWDGYINKNKQVQFSSVDKSAVDVVQALAVISGQGSCVSSYKPKKENWKTVHSITIGVRNYFLTEKLTKETYNYEGKVYCCTVNSGNLVIRAGECPIICGNSRRGSIAAYLDITHPEILSFLEMRSPTGGDANKKCFNLNNAVNIPDSFMRAVILGEEYELIDPKHGATGRKLPAREVWEKLMQMRFETGEPYINFIDTVNRNIPKWITKPTYNVRQSNLCSEITLMTSAKRTAVCCLSSLNLDKFDEWKDTTIVEDLVRYLDNVLEYFIRLAPVELKRAVYSASKERAIGLGTLGFHSWLQKNRIAFESGGFNSAASENYKLYSLIKERAITSSKQLAKERGEAPDCYGSGMRNSHLLAVA